MNDDALRDEYEPDESDFDADPAFDSSDRSASGPDEADDTSPWRAPRGRVTRVIAWIILAVIMATVAAMIVAVALSM